MFVRKWITHCQVPTSPHSYGYGGVCLNSSIDFIYHFIVKYSTHTEKHTKQKCTAKKKKSVEGSICHKGIPGKSTSTAGKQKGFLYHHRKVFQDYTKKGHGNKVKQAEDVLK